MRREESVVRKKMLFVRAKEESEELEVEREER
jgi:hypothetical protein